MPWLCVSFLFYVISLVFCDGINYRDVTIKQGVVRGYREGNIYGFYSIPYATVPTGLDFYKGPLPPPVWSGIFNATERNIICHQPIEVAGPPVGYRVEKQCLIANVFVPDSQPESLPVVVYIHGGGFQIGSGNRFTPKYLVGGSKVIAVTFNYRLGPHGFLCLGTDVAPGNAGMKDQVEVLKWVRRNIINFGGNPNNVTLAGYSAGSVSVDLLQLSKMAKGLFNKVIIESGSNLNAISVQIDPLGNAKWFAKQFGLKDVNNVTALENFYLHTPYETIVTKTAPLMSRSDSTTIFTPCIEKDLGQEMFLDENPITILERGNFTKLPMLYGFSDMEGLLHISMFDDWKSEMNRDFVSFLPSNIGGNTKERYAIAEKVRKFYFGDESITDDNILDFVTYISDVLIKHGLLRSARLQVAAGNKQVYFYEYVFVDEDQPYIPHTAYRGAGHCAQTDAVMDTRNEYNISEQYKRIKSSMRELWTNFITTGTPVPDGSHLPIWKPMTPENSYMLINTTLEYKNTYEYAGFKLWDEIMEKHYRYASAPNPNSGFSLKSNAVEVLLTLLLLTLTT